MLATLYALLFCAISACSALYDAELSRRNSTGLTNAVTWDSHSLLIQGQRVFILSAEIHPWKLPGNPDLWADIFQKVKANGFNTVSFYVNWALHFPTPTTNNGQGDFQEGTYRDIQRFIDEAKKAGLWLIARPGPYINGETTGGGFPGWVGNIAGSLRTDNPSYQQAWTPYMTAISKIIARNQITNGGPIILVQAENEFSASAAHNVYMQAIIDLYRANGIVVPITHNDQHAGQAGNFSPDLPGTHVNIYCGDSYPQGGTRWNQVQTIYHSAHEAVAPNNPLCLAEFGGGFLLGWGGAARGSTGYEKFSNDLTDASYENVFYKDTYAPTVANPPTVTSSFSNGTLTLNYSLAGSQFVTITSGSNVIVAIVLDKATANTWHAPTIPGSGPFKEFFSVGTNQTVLIGGPYLVRTASISGNTLTLTGDLNGTTSVEFIAPPAVSAIKWNGASATVTKTSRGSFNATIAGASSITLPTLTNWKVSGSLPEIDPAFDDSSFVTADQTTTNYTNLPVLAGNRVLYSQQYGFYGGNLIFRGHFTASGQETTVTTTVQYGFAGVPANTLRIGSDNVFVIVQDHMGIVETSTNGGKEPRGIRGFAIEGGNTTFSQWKLQGNQGGAADAPDTFRGYLNEGGLYAERIGAHLPGFPDSSWASGTPLTGGGVSDAGINFYRTTFTLDVPDGVDFPIRLSITPSAITSNFRVQIYLNGWQVGKYINNIGPQSLFVLPAWDTGSSGVHRRIRWRCRFGRWMAQEPPLLASSSSLTGHSRHR
ncbi:putative beta-galactosidase, domain 3 [Lyophyllum shimeji]|uniref:Beta-galactosidase n=1 Tax=Lyophyllum shimeji TaxID=47721 RepID=A0A9P3PUR7_LYOSH|nr:putative beta-galactosidase, domain 3 [Lyophyllum shimeji]